MRYTVSSNSVVEQCRRTCRDCGLRARVLFPAVVRGGSGGESRAVRGGSRGKVETNLGSTERMHLSPVLLSLCFSPDPARPYL